MRVCLETVRAQSEEQAPPLGRERMKGVMQRQRLLIVWRIGDE
jgi:hypothetical protein